MLAFASPFEEGRRAESDRSRSELAGSHRKVAGLSLLVGSRPPRQRPLASGEVSTRVGPFARGRCADARDDSELASEPGATGEQTKEGANAWQSEEQRSIRLNRS